MSTKNEIIYNPYFRYILDFIDEDLTFRYRIWRLYNLVYSNAIYAPSDEAYDLAQELAEEIAKKHYSDIDDLTKWLVKNVRYIVYWDNSYNKWDLTIPKAVRLFFRRPKNKCEYLLFIAILAEILIIIIPIFSFFCALNSNLQTINVSILFMAGLIMIIVNHIGIYFMGSNNLLIRNSLLKGKDVFFPLYGYMIFNILEIISLSTISYALGTSFSKNLDILDAIIFGVVFIIIYIKNIIKYI